MAEYIEREALKEVVANLRFGKHLNKDAALNLMDRAIDNLPAADVVEVKHGRWVPYTYTSCGIKKTDGFVATCCSSWNKIREKFCPHCGALMDGE